jgi:hypothetical protein
MNRQSVDTGMNASGLRSRFRDRIAAEELKPRAKLKVLTALSIAPDSGYGMAHTSTCNPSRTVTSILTSTTAVTD